MARVPAVVKSHYRFFTDGTFNNLLIHKSSFFV